MNVIRIDFNNNPEGIKQYLTWPDAFLGVPVYNPEDNIIEVYIYDEIIFCDKCRCYDSECRECTLFKIDVDRLDYCCFGERKKDAASLL